MKQIKEKIVWLIAFLVIGSIPVFGKPFAVGPYLGQTPPGSMARVFAPGLICDMRPHQWESPGHFSADGNSFCFYRCGYIYITENTATIRPNAIVFIAACARPEGGLCRRN